MPLAFYPQYKDNYVILHGSSGPGLLCFSSLDITTANVICKSTLGLFGIQIRSGEVSPTVFGETRYSAFFDCTGDEYSLSECRTHMVAVESCARLGREAIVDCSTSE